MSDNALLKIDRAARHIAELNELLKEKRPFRYVLQTNIKTGERSLLAKRNEAVIDEVVTIVADIVHNLRTSLDQAYWPIVSPFAISEKEKRAIQFPFSETAGRLQEGVKNRLADRVSTSFFQALIDLKPYGESGGNELLWLIHSLNGLDKHRFPIPTADYKTLSSEDMRKMVPDFPPGLEHVGLGSNRIDVAWTSRNFDRSSIGEVLPGRMFEYEKELKIPVDVVFAVGGHGSMRPLIPTLHLLVDVAKTTISIIRKAV